MEETAQRYGLALCGVNRARYLPISTCHHFGLLSPNPSHGKRESAVQPVTQETWEVCGNGMDGMDGDPGRVGGETTASGVRRR